MSISLNTYAAGDTNYIAKLNADNATITTAINNLLTSVGAGGGSISYGTMLLALFGLSSVCIGNSSYACTTGSTSLSIAVGYCWKPSTLNVLQNASTTVISFSGQAAGTYYIAPNNTGVPTLQSVATDSMYTVVWSGTAFTSVTKTAYVFMSAPDENGLLTSTTNSTSYSTVLARFEAIETAANVVASATVFGKVKVDGTTITAAGGVISAGSGTALISNIQQDTYIFGTDTGVANAYNVSQTPAPTLVAGSQCVFKCANTNTGASTLAINGGAAVAIKKQGSVALAAGDLVAGQMVDLTYDGTNWQLIASAGNNAVPVSGAAGQVYAAPAGASGTLTPRALVGSDLPVATTSALGGVKPDGSTITITGGGVISAAFAGGATVSSVQQDAYVYAADTGSANAYAVALSPAPTLIAGSQVNFKAANANTGASTIAVNGGTATAIKKNGSTALAAGDIAVGQIVSLTYDGTYWQMPASSPNNGATSPMTIGFVLNSGATGTNVGPLLVAPRAGTLNSLVIVTKASDGSTPLTIDILQNGTSIFTSTKPSVAAGTAAGTVSTFTTLTSVPLSVAKGDVFQLNVTSGTSTWQATLQLET